MHLIDITFNKYNIKLDHKTILFFLSHFRKYIQRYNNITFLWKIAIATKINMKNKLYISLLHLYYRI